MKTIARLENKLSKLRGQLNNCSNPDERSELEEQIDYMQDEIDEIEAEERDNQDYEEMTGTTAQDLYLERNSHAIRQSEMIDRFRNEY